MNKDFEQDFVSEFLDSVFTNSPCDRCADREECNFDNSSKCCEKKFNTMLQAERIA